MPNETPSPVLENKDSSSLNTPLNDAYLLNHTHDDASNLETKKTDLSQDETKTAPCTPKKSPAQKPIEAQNFGSWIASEQVHNKIYSYQNKRNNTSCSGNYLMHDDKINLDKNDDFTRYKLEQISNLFPTDSEIDTLVARFVVVGKLDSNSENDSERELLLSVAGTKRDQSKDVMSHAQLAAGKEDHAECFSAGEIHFSKKDKTWLIDSINNKTGHFLCDFEALHMPIKMLLAKKELWDDVVTIGRATNSQRPGGKPTFYIETCKFSVNKSSETGFSLTCKEQEFTLKPLISPALPVNPVTQSEVVTSLLTFGSANNFQSLFSLSIFNTQATSSESHATSQQVHQIEESLTHSETQPRIPLPKINITAANSFKLNGDSSQSCSDQSGCARERKGYNRASTNFDASSSSTLFSSIPSSNSGKVSVVRHHVHNNIDNNIMDDDLFFNLDFDTDSNSSTDTSGPQ